MDNSCWLGIDRLEPRGTILVPTSIIGSQSSGDCEGTCWSFFYSSAFFFYLCIVCIWNLESILYSSIESRKLSPWIVVGLCNHNNIIYIPPVLPLPSQVFPLVMVGGAVLGLGTSTTAKAVELRSAPLPVQSWLSLCCPHFPSRPDSLYTVDFCLLWEYILDLVYTML